MDYYETGQTIRKFRKVKGLSQEELAYQINISTTHMSHIETGNTKLSLGVLIHIADVLDVRVDTLLNRSSKNIATASYQEIASLLEDCSPKEAQILIDIIKAAKNSLDLYL